VDRNPATRAAITTLLGTDISVIKVQLDDLDDQAKKIQNSLIF
jgi:hypothetical protein